MAKAPKAKRYAQALFELAQQQRAAEAWRDDLNELARALSDESVASFLSSPRASAADKRALVSRLNQGRDATFANFVGLLTERRAMGLIQQIVEEYGDLVNESLGRVRAEVTTAAQITSTQEQRLRSTLGASLQKTIVVDAHEDPEIIGGMVVRVGDQIIDGSVRAKLASLKQRLAHESLR